MIVSSVDPFFLVGNCNVPVICSCNVPGNCITNVENSTIFYFKSVSTWQEDLLRMHEAHKDSWDMTVTDKYIFLISIYGILLCITREQFVGSLTFLLLKINNNNNNKTNNNDQLLEEQRLLSKRYAASQFHCSSH